MLLKELINKSYYGVIGYISSDEDLSSTEQYILYNLPVLKEFKQVIVATNYSNNLQTQSSQLWKKYFPECIIINSEINRGHNHGNADLDNLIFDYCKKENIKWLCKSVNDIILSESILTKEVDEADFYYLNGISYKDLYLTGFDYNKILNEHLHPQTNFYFIDVSKCDYLNNKQYLDDTFEQIKYIPNYNGKIWEYIDEWSCEGFLRKCVERNNLRKYYLAKDKHNKLCDTIKLYQIGDPSHKNIMIEGICHFHFRNQNILKI
jgi:hypothetical protein